MPWAKRTVCAAGAVLLAAVGCTSPESFGLNIWQQGPPNSGSSYVNASMDGVAASVQASLKKMGLAAEVRPEGESVRIVSRTSGGGAFSLLLTRAQTGAGDQTLVKVEWEKPKDGGAALQIFGQVCAAAAFPGSTSRQDNSARPAGADVQK